MLSGFAGEEDEARFVGFEARDVQGEGFFVGRLAAGVDGDPDCGGEFAGDVGFLCWRGVSGAGWKSETVGSVSTGSPRACVSNSVLCVYCG